MKTPVAFLIFNRPETTEKVFEVIRQAKPPKLLVVADGPRQNRPQEAEKCAAVRAIIDRVDWECEVLTNYSDVNLGCKGRIASGIDWIFTLVEEAIILEDDCLVHQSFFPYCEELLERYRDDERIMVISGDNFQFGRDRTEYSYYFSRYSHVWGWATWRRAWQHYDLEMKLWPKIRDEHWLEAILEEPSAIDYWTKIFQNARDGLIDTWDYQWTFACWVQNGLTILPRVNLVSNIGFSKEGTHETDNNNPLANLPSQPMAFPLKHPTFIIRNAGADDFTQKHILQDSLMKRLIKKFQRVIGERSKKFYLERA